MKRSFSTVHPAHRCRKFIVSERNRAFFVQSISSLFFKPKPFQNKTHMCTSHNWSVHFKFEKKNERIMRRCLFLFFFFTNYRLWGFDLSTLMADVSRVWPVRNEEGFFCLTESPFGHFLKWKNHWQINLFSWFCCACMSLQPHSDNKARQERKLNPSSLSGGGEKKQKRHLFSVWSLKNI